MQIERRHIEQTRAGVQVEKRADGQMVVSGYAAVYFNPSDPQGTQYRLWTGYYERIMPGAFDRAVREDDVRCLFNHDPSGILGRTSAGTLTLSVDSKGLRYEAILPETQCAKDTQVSIARRDVTGSSFGFGETNSVYREEGDVAYREIEQFKLVFDVGPVTFPAYAATSTEVAQRSLQAWRAEQQQRLERSIRRARLLEG